MFFQSLRQVFPPDDHVPMRFFSPFCTTCNRSITVDMSDEIFFFPFCTGQASCKEIYFPPLYQSDIVIIARRRDLNKRKAQIKTCSSFLCKRKRGNAEMFYPERVAARQSASNALPRSQNVLRHGWLQKQNPRGLIYKPQKVLLAEHRPPLESKRQKHAETRRNYTDPEYTTPTWVDRGCCFLPLSVESQAKFMRNSVIKSTQ